MAALQTKEDSATRTVLQSPLLPSLGNLGSTLVWVIILGFFFLPDLLGREFNWVNVSLVIAIGLFLVGASVWTSLVSTRVVVDQTPREVTLEQRLFGIPLRTTVIPFGDLATLELASYRKSAGKRTVEMWRADAVTKSGQRVPLNWDGTRDGMAEIAQKVAQRTGARFAATLDSAPVALAQPPRMTRETPRPPHTAPSRSRPDAQAPPPVATPPWLIPAYGGELAPLAPAPAPEPTPPPAEMPAAAPAESPATRSAERPAQVSVWTLPVSALDKRVSADPMDSDARYALARRNHAANQLDRAIQLYRETLRIDPTNAEAQNDLGAALQMRGKRTEAETAYRRAVALDPFSFVAQMNLGLLLRGLNRAAEASQAFYQARQSAKSATQTQIAEAASTGAKIDPQLSPH